MTARSRLSILAVAALAAVPGAEAATAPPVPAHCPAKAIVARTLHLRARRVETRLRTVGSVSQVGGFGAPTAAAPRRPAGRERTCVYTTSAMPVTIVFTSPVAARAFASARSSFARSRNAVVAVRGLGDSAFATPDGELFVLEGRLETVVSAAGARPAALAALVRAIP
jgi:hypothetical protein